nr:hypothetical protein [Conexibacter sp. W3-3-2]
MLAVAGIDRRRDRADPGVGHEDVDAAGLLSDLAAGLLQRLEVGDVNRPRERAATQSSGGGGRGVCVDVQERAPGPAARTLLREREADTGAPTGDQDRAAAEL